MEQWRQFLQEGRYEAATTEMTRKVMEHVKMLLENGLPQEPNKRGDGRHPMMPKRFEKRRGDLPKELGELMSYVNYKFLVDPLLFEETGNKFTIGGKFGKDEMYPEDNHLEVTSYLSKEFSEQDFNDYLADLKGTTIHEIQHGGQADETWETATPRSEAGELTRGYNYNRLSGLQNYYGSDAEIDSYTKEIYKKAKYYKKPFSEIMDARLEQFFNMFKRRRDKMNAEDEREVPGEQTRVRYSEEELRDFFFKELRDIFINAAKKKYPEAQGI